MDGETIMHCSTCHDKHAVTVEEADRWREVVRKACAGQRGFGGQRFMEKPTQVLTVIELAEYLRVHPSTIYRLLKKHALPAFKVGAEWRFSREAIDRWRMERQAQ